MTQLRIGSWTAAPSIDAVRSGGAFLKAGQTGPAVEELQKKLAMAGFPVEADAKLGPATEAAIRRFQQANGLAVDGVAGPQTLRALESSFQRPPRPSVPGIGSTPVPPPPARPTAGTLPYEAEAIAKHGPEFVAKVKDLAARRGFKPEWLMAIMKNESGLSPSIKNGIGATGLIQFMPATAKGLGTTTDQLAKMSGLEQLDYVDKFYSKFPPGSFKTGSDLYLAAFYPVAIGKADDFVLGSENGTAASVGAANRPFDLNKDGQISVREFREYYAKKFPTL